MTEIDDYDQWAGANIREVRAWRGMTQAELAELVSAAGLSWQQQTVVKVEAGQRPLRLREAVVIAEALGVPVEVLAQSRAVDAELRKLESLRSSYVKKIEEIDGELSNLEFERRKWAQSLSTVEERLAELALDGETTGPLRPLKPEDVPQQKDRAWRESHDEDESVF